MDTDSLECYHERKVSLYHYIICRGHYVELLGFARRSLYDIDIQLRLDSLRRRTCGEAIANEAVRRRETNLGSLAETGANAVVCPVAPLSSSPATPFFCSRYGI